MIRIFTDEETYEFLPSSAGKSAFISGICGKQLPFPLRKNLCAPCVKTKSSWKATDISTNIFQTLRINYICNPNIK